MLTLKQINLIKNQSSSHLSYNVSTSELCDELIKLKNIIKKQKRELKLLHNLYKAIKEHQHVYRECMDAPCSIDIALKNLEENNDV